MKERPILMNQFSVRAILDGRKTQTRRIIQPQPQNVEAFRWKLQDDGSDAWYYSKINYSKIRDDDSFRDLRSPIWESLGSGSCPYGMKGDRLWVREAWQLCAYSNWREFSVRYMATENVCAWVRCTRDLDVLKEKGFKSSIHMPREFSRVTLEITDVCVERVQDITYQDILAEGLGEPPFVDEHEAVIAWMELWDSINAKRGLGWNENPWVWVISFRPIPALRTSTTETQKLVR